MEMNPEHLKYMPKTPGMEPEEPEAQEVPVAVEEVVEIVEPPEVPVSAIMEQEASMAPSEEGAEAPKGLKDLLEIFYFLFNPLLVPAYACLLIFTLSILHIVAPTAALPYTLTVFGATGLVPFLTIFILQKVGVVESFYMKRPGERTVPYAIDFLAFGAMAIFFVYMGANAWIWTMFCGGAAIALVNMIINFRMRISSHCSAMAGLLAVLIVLNTYGIPQVSLFWWMVGAVFFAGVVGTAAIFVGKHTIWEVTAGYATGFLGIILFSLIH